ncbi:probable disease resistance protein At4g27220 [Telopea speciosissima]|uniref:probable disease resistance protein At4g27220 n=1 Tax=Telopea speciosissima TaxID=54955 RepID=UPI001CC553FC|nr:probable disease resistance protein At4g27220 [Telopea speciosissima]
MQTLDFQVYSSTKLAMDRIMKALKDEDTNIVGVYGMAGVGKTTLMKEVAKNLKEEFFDVVVMVTVSQDMDLKKIQGNIAENLGLPLTEESLNVRARRLSNRLKKEKRILIVLDDLWKPLNLLDDLGILCGKNCKVVLTTRQLDVCNQMKTKSEVKVKVLSEGDAWDLFKWAAGIEDDDMLHSVAKQIVGECGGLPLAILAIGRALRGKDISVWEDEASQLKKSSSLLDIKGMPHEKVFCSIKLSYDALANDATKSCFLLCCMFPEDFSISEDDLLPYVVGEGMVEDIDNLFDARNRLHSWMEILKGSCLLLDDGGRKGCVRMHDVIRDVAIWIASKEGHDFVVRSGRGLTHWPNKEKLTNCKRLSLMQNEITKLPNQQLQCFQLMTLSLKDNRALTEIPDGFFLGMISLKTLDLEKTNLSHIPSSLSCLTDLRVLRISSSSCQPFDVSLLGKLKKLEILHLPNSNVLTLPGEIEEFTNLKSLNLAGNPGLTIVPNALSRLHLQELDLLGSFHEWEIEGGSEDGRRSKACLSEVASLSHLSKLNIKVSNIKCSSANIPFHWEKLKCFSVTLGDDWPMDSSVYEFNNVVLISGSIQPPPLSNWMVFLLERAEGLQLKQCDGLKYIVSLSGAQGLNKLRILHVYLCGDVEFLLSTAVEAEDLEVPRIAFKSLEKLYLKSLPKLTAICYGHLPSGCFNKLRFIYVQNCFSLICVIPSDLLPNLPNLEVLQVLNCSRATEVFNYSKRLQAVQSTLTELKRLDLRLLKN